MDVHLGMNDVANTDPQWEYDKFVDLRVRKSPRATFHNYSAGDYFVTVCTLGKKCYFGRIVNGEMRLSPLGQYCASQLQDVKRHYPYAEAPLFVVMPNHIHVIISINPNDKSSLRGSLGVIIGGLKRQITMYARQNNIEFGWQSRYHDHIIRGPHDGNRIADYIQTNPARWSTDRFHVPTPPHPVTN